MNPIVNEESTDTHKIVRHAIKNDISVIIAFAQLVKLNPHDPRVGEFLEKIELRSKQILVNVEKFLDDEAKQKVSE